MKLSSVYFIFGCCIIPFLIFLLPVDALNAYLLRGNESFGVSFGQFYKLPVIFMMLICLILNPRIFFLISVLFSFLLIPTVFNFNLNFGHLIRDIINITKYLTPLISYYFFTQLWKSNCRLRVIFDFWIYFSYSILAFTILASVVGLGTPMYDEELGDQNIGTRGLFYSGNEVSITFIVLLSFISYKIRKHKIKYAFLIFNLILSILISAKTAILGVFLINIFISISEDRISLTKRERFKKSIILLLVFIILSIIVWQIILNSPLIIRLIYFFNKLDFLTFILSARNLYLLNAYDIFTGKYSFFEFMFGLGYQEYITVIIKMIEIDLFDIFFTYGIFGALVFLFSILLHLYNTVKSKFIDSSYSFNIGLILFMISNFTGHTFGSGMAGIFIGFVMSYYKSTENKDITKVLNSNLIKY